MTPPATSLPTEPEREHALPDERVPVGLYINPVRGLIIGLTVILLLILALVLILQPTTPPKPFLLSIDTPSAGAVIPALPPSNIPVTLRLGTQDGAALSVEAVGNYRVVATLSRTHGPNLSKVQCSYDLSERTYVCPLPIPTDVRTDGTAYLITVKASPAARSVGGLAVSVDGPVVQPVDDSTTNPITVRFT